VADLAALTPLPLSALAHFTPSSVCLLALSAAIERHCRFN